MTRGDNAATAGGLTSSDNSQVKKRARFHNPHPGIGAVGSGFRRSGVPLEHIFQQQADPTTRAPQPRLPLPGSNNPLSPKVSKFSFWIYVDWGEAVEDACLQEAQGHLAASLNKQGYFAVSKRSTERVPCSSSDSFKTLPTFLLYLCIYDHQPTAADRSPKRLAL
ncbi:hypothetical protein Anapl_13144 [Anas platyrhynchos]|uniref:Uncharacterized protein n=1 Tax=Anas platyrhynchos TaxID=8839 RepID=R0K0G7_ANAPL|nr:hypothetical protein Anapl_13144 [Anas platyrhynchos]